MCFHEISSVITGVTTLHDRGEMLKKKKKNLLSCSITAHQKKRRQSKNNLQAAKDGVSVSLVK